MTIPLPYPHACVCVSSSSCEASEVQLKPKDQDETAPVATDKQINKMLKILIVLMNIGVVTIQTTHIN